MNIIRLRYYILNPRLIEFFFSEVRDFNLKKKKRISKVVRKSLYFFITSEKNKSEKGNFTCRGSVLWSVEVRLRRCSTPRSTE